MPSLSVDKETTGKTKCREHSDTSSNLETATSYFISQHPSASHKPTTSDIAFIRDLASLISRRGAALLAAAVFALWELRHEAEAEAISQQPRVAAAATRAATVKKEKGEVVVRVSETTNIEETRDGVVVVSSPPPPPPQPPQATKVAFNGSVIEHYPRYRASCQARLDGLLAQSSRPACAVDLVPAVESSLLGAAVALASAAEATTKVVS